MQKPAAWEAAFAKGDIEAGYFLVEYYNKKPKKGEPSTTLQSLRKKVPDDYELLTELVKNYRKERRFKEATDLLLELAKLQPSRERDVYTQISEIKTEERKDDEAEKYQKMAVAKSPRDPSGYERMGERYVEMQRFADAIAAYEKVLELDIRNTKAAFALAQLYIQSNKPKRAAELLRNVVRSALSEEDVRRAAREAIDLEEMTDSLGDLEKVLSPLSFMMAHKPVYRQVLVELYLRYIPRLVERQRHGNEEIQKAAREELKRVGGHGLQPLLEALRDEKEPAQQRVAVSVLGHLGNKGAAAPLVHMARQEPPKDSRHIGTLQESLDREVRVDALVAAGRLGDAKVLDDVLPLMDHPELTMKEAATFTLGRSGDRKAVPALVNALNATPRSVQTLACLGLAQIDDTRSTTAVVAALNDARKLDAARAACAYALGARRAATGVPALLDALIDNRGETQRLAAWALGQIGDPKTLGPLIRAYFARAGRASDELVWAIGRVSGAALQPSPLGPLGDYPLSRGKYDPAAAVALLPGELATPPAFGKLVVDHADDIAKGLTDALAEHRDVVVAVLADLDGNDTEISLGALAPTTNDAKLTAALTKVGQAIAPGVSAQLTSEDPKVRALAVSVLAKIRPAASHVNDADAAVRKALGDPMDQVRASAMNAIAVLAQRRGSVPKDLLASLTKALTSGPWVDRPVAVHALAKLGAGGDLPALYKAAGDSSSFVREAVAASLTPDGRGLEVLLQLSNDEIAQVRAAAARSLAPSKDERAKRRRIELQNDPEQVVRQAAS
jgi:HEAT repeat protein